MGLYKPYKRHLKASKRLQAFKLQGKSKKEATFLIHVASEGDDTFYKAAGVDKMWWVVDHQAMRDAAAALPLHHHRW